MSVRHSNRAVETGPFPLFLCFIKRLVYFVTTSNKHLSISIMSSSYSIAFWRSL